MFAVLAISDDEELPTIYFREENRSLPSYLLSIHFFFFFNISLYILY